MHYECAPCCGKALNAARGLLNGDSCLTSSHLKNNECFHSVSNTLATHASSTCNTVFVKTEQSVRFMKKTSDAKLLSVGRRRYCFCVVLKLHS